MIYIIGDSHVSVFSGTDKTYEGLRHIQPDFGIQYTIKKGQLQPKINRFEQRIPYFCPVKIWSPTAYNSYNKLPIIEQVIDEYNVTNKDYIFTCFGEIDIRHHIGQNAEKQNISITEGIKICVDRYMKTVLYLKEHYNNVGVYAPPASSVSTGYKDIIFRNKMTLEFNQYLKEKCNENDIIFKDISYLMMLPDGTTDPKYIMDDIHLSQEAMVFLIQEFSDISKNNLSNEI